MASRFYLKSTAQHGENDGIGIKPAADANWEISSSLARRLANTVKQNSAMASASIAGDTDATNRDYAIRQFITEPLAAQTISAQTVKLQMRASETSTSNNLFLTIGIRAVSNDGSTIRGTLLAVTRDATELATTLTNRAFSATSSSVTIQDGDRLVIEIGVGGDPAVGANHNSSISVGDNAASDLAENDTATTADNPWVEFANTLTFTTSPAFDAASSASGSAVSSRTFSHTVSGSNRLLVVGVSAESAIDRAVSSITYDGVSLTKIREDTRSDGTNTHRTELWYLLAPNTGTHDIVVTMAGSVDDLAAGGISYTGISQSGQPDANNGANGNSGTPSVDITTVADNCIVFDVVNIDGSSTLTSTGTGQIIRWENEPNTGNFFGGAQGPVSPAGSTTMDYASTSRNWVISAASFKPFIAGTDYNTTLNETVTLTDSFIRGRIMSETLVLTDTIIKRIERTLIDNIILVDSIIKGRIFSEAVILTDTILRTPGKVLSETVSLTDTLLRSIGKVLSETLQIGDGGRFALSFDGNDHVTVTANSVFNTSNFSYMAWIKRNASGAIHTIKGNNANGGPQFRIASDNKIELLKQNIVSIAKSTPTITDTNTHHVGVSYNSSTGAYAFYLDGQPAGSGTNLQTFIFSNIALGLKIQQGSEGMNGVIWDYLHFDRVLTPTEFLDAFNGSPPTDEVLGLLLNEGTGNPADSSGNGNNGTITGAAWVGAPVRPSPVVTISRSISETVSLTDTLESLKLAIREFTESISFTDELLKTPGKVFSETISLIDTFIGQITARVLSETITLTDTLSKLSGRIFSEVLSFTDTIVRLPGKVLSEAISMTDTALKSTGRVMSETVSLTDTFASLVVRAYEFLESIVLTDTLTRTIGKVVSETVSLTDTITRVSSRVFAEVLTITDSILKLPGRIMTETVSLTDSIIKTPGKVLSETIRLLAGNTFALSLDGSSTGNMTAVYNAGAMAVSNKVTLFFIGKTRSNVAPSSYFNVVNKGAYQTSGFQVFLLNLSANSMRFRVRLNRSDAISPFFDAIDGPSGINTTIPHSYAWTFDAGVSKLFIDGVKVAEKTHASPYTSLINSTGSFIVANEGGRYFDGWMDKMVFSNSRAMSEQDIQDLHNDVLVDQSGVSILWDFHEGSGNAIDKSGNNITGTLGAGASYDLVDLPFTNTGIFKSTSRLLSDTVSLADTILRIPGRIVSETISLTDTMLRSAGKVLSDTFNLTDIVESTSNILVELSETLHLTDIFAKSMSFFKTLTETLSLTDIFTRSIGKVFSETLSLLDRLHLNVNGKKWYAKTRTLFQSGLNTIWNTKNSQAFSRKNNTDWYEKQDTDWEEET